MYNHYLHGGTYCGHAVSEHAEFGCQGQSLTAWKPPHSAQNAYFPFHWMTLSTGSPDD